MQIYNFATENLKHIWHAGNIPASKMLIYYIWKVHGDYYGYNNIIYGCLYYRSPHTMAVLFRFIFKNILRKS